MHNDKSSMILIIWVNMWIRFLITLNLKQQGLNMHRLNLRIKTIGNICMKLLAQWMENVLYLLID